MILLIGFAFLAGIVTILSPCIIPILPVVLSGSVSGNRRRPLGIIIGFAVSFTIFTLFLAGIIRLLGLPTNILRDLAVIILLFFGISLLMPRFQIIIEKVFARLARYAPSTNRSGFVGGVIIGLTIGIVWAPCVGPIMASVIALAAVSQVSTVTFFITAAYAVGSSIPMFFIMYGGRRLLQKVPALTKNSVKIQKGFGIIMLVIAFMFFLNLDTQFEAFIASTPYGSDLTNLEANTAVENQLSILKGGKKVSVETSSGLFNADYPAPDFTGITQWLNNPDGNGINSRPISMQQLRGKVVLVDFWTYTCINCIRTLPHVTNWYDKYEKDGFVVIGVHTPEFQFEHQTGNVENAIKLFHIYYPVAQDNNYKTWTAYNNEYWPAEYLIDANGNVRRTDFGEGGYDQMEKAIQLLLKDAGQNVSMPLSNIKDQTPTGNISPESYVGSERMQYEFPNGQLTSGAQTFSAQKNIPVNTFSFGGKWNIEDQYSIASKNATLAYHFTAGKVFLVMDPGTNKKGRAQVFLDGSPISKQYAGDDVLGSYITVSSDRLYNLVNLHGQTGDHILTLDFLTLGIQAYAFTFGS